MSKITDFAIAHQNAVAEFEARLNKFDWWYDYNDTLEYWQGASKIHNELKKIASTHPDFQEAYNRVVAEKAPSNFK
jgi:hypothetical protein